MWWQNICFLSLNHNINICGITNLSATPPILISSSDTRKRDSFGSCVLHSLFLFVLALSVYRRSSRLLWWLSHRENPPRGLTGDGYEEIIKIVACFAFAIVVGFAHGFGIWNSNPNPSNPITSTCRDAGQTFVRLSSGFSIRGSALPQNDRQCFVPTEIQLPQFEWQRTILNGDCLFLTYIWNLELFYRSKLTLQLFQRLVLLFTSVMNQFVQRVANYVANEIIIKGLANSKTFQKFAVRTNKQYNDTVKQGAETINKTMDDMATQQAGMSASQAAGTATASGPPKPPLRGIPGFFVAFGKEVKKDITGV